MASGFKAMMRSMSGLIEFPQSSILPFAPLASARRRWMSLMRIYLESQTPTILSATPRYSISWQCTVVNTTTRLKGFVAFSVCKVLPCCQGSRTVMAESPSSLRS